MQKTKPIIILVPDGPLITLFYLLLDFTGTLARDGILLSGVAARIRRLSRRVKITVVTADTMGCAARALEGLPVEIRFVKTGIDKARLIGRLGASHTAAIGNGRNDAGMIRKAALGIAVVGPEGASGTLVAAADVVVRDVRDALDLISNPLRLLATLRE